MAVLGLLDYMRYKEWNKLVTNIDIHMKLESENCMISCAKFTKFLRPFTFLTHLCEYQGSFYLVMKSMEQTDKQKIFYSTVIKV